MRRKPVAVIKNERQVRRISSLINLTRRHYLFSLCSLVSWGWHDRPPQLGGEDIFSVCNHQKGGVVFVFRGAVFPCRGRQVGTTTAWAGRVWASRTGNGGWVTCFQSFSRIDHLVLIEQNKYDFPWTEFPWQHVGKLTLLDVLMGHLNTYWISVEERGQFQSIDSLKTKNNKVPYSVLTKCSPTLPSSSFPFYPLPSLFSILGGE